MDKVFLWKAGGRVIHHTDLQAAADLDGLVRKPDKTVTTAEWEAAQGRAFINASGEIMLGEPADVTARREEVASLTREEAKLQSELDAKDYKVIKASENGRVLAEIEPELHTRRDWCRNRITEIRERLAELAG